MLLFPLFIGGKLLGCEFLRYNVGEMSGTFCTFKLWVIFRKWLLNAPTALTGRTSLVPILNEGGIWSQQHISHHMPPVTFLTSLTMFLYIFAYITFLVTFLMMFQFVFLCFLDTSMKWLKYNLFASLITFLKTAKYLL